MNSYKRAVPYVEFYCPAPTLEDYVPETSSMIDNFYFPYTSEEKDLIIRYLNTGELYLSMMEALLDIKDNSYIGGHGMLTDGVWEWRSDVSYYVNKYNLKLASDFINHILYTIRLEPNF